MPHLYPPEHWRKLAHETRQIAAMLSLPSDKLNLVRMAEGYDRQARTADLRLHRASVQQINTLMRATSAEMRMTIMESRALVERTLGALHGADLLLSGTPFVRKGTVSWLE